jgi:hypothetical protein
MNFFRISPFFLTALMAVSCLVSSDNNLTDITDVVGEYIKKNELPIAVGKEITVYNDFSITDKTNFQIFMLGLLNTLSNDISEGNYNDKTIEDFIETQRILTGFYGYCADNNYELATVFDNTYNDKNLFIEYFEYYNYNLTFHNNWVIFDNNTDYVKLKNLIGVSLQMGDITRNNIVNFLHNRDGENAFVYKSIIFTDGIIETVGMDSNEYFDAAFELGFMHVCYCLISDMIHLFKIRGYDLGVYANTWAEITEKNKELEKLIDNYNNR